jgi:Uma2 family endonuclease
MNLSEFEALINDNPDVRYEYLDGRAYAMVGGSADHNRLMFSMAKLIDIYLTSGPCRVFLADMYMQVHAQDRVLPDAVVTCDISDYCNKSKLIHSPHLIVEILSPSTERVDRGEKFAAYIQIPSLQEYVLVHQDQQRVEVYRRIDDWEWRVFGAGDEFELVSLDIPISMDELYAALR